MIMIIIIRLWLTEFDGFFSRNKFSEFFFQILINAPNKKDRFSQCLKKLRNKSSEIFQITMIAPSWGRFNPALKHSSCPGCRAHLKKKRISRIFFLTFLQQMQNRAPCIFSAVMLLKRQLKYCLVALQVNMKSIHKGCFVTMNL